MREKRPHPHIRAAALALGFFWAAVCPPAVSFAAAKTPAEIAKKAENAVVLIEVFDRQGLSLGHGSGFLAAPNGVILTAYHVIEGAHAAQVKFKDGQLFKKVEVLAADEGRDLAALKIDLFTKRAVPLGDSDEVQKGDRVVTIGNPLGWENTLSDGIVSEIRTQDGRKMIQISAQISQGSSGGPLFDLNGEAVGITTSLVEEGQNLNFASPINYARPLLESKTTTPLAEFTVGRRIEKMREAFHPVTEFKSQKIREDSLWCRDRIEKLSEKMIPVYDAYNDLIESQTVAAEEYARQLKTRIIPAYVSFIGSLSAMKPKTRAVEAILRRYTEQAALQHAAALDDYYAQLFGNQYLKDLSTAKLDRATELRETAMEMLSFILEENGEEE